MESTLHVFVIPKGASPAGPPRPAGTFPLEADGIEALREAAHRKLADDKFHIRSLSFGPKGLIAYVEAIG